MRFGFQQPLVGEKRYVTTLITAAEETNRRGETTKSLMLSGLMFNHV